LTGAILLSLLTALLTLEPGPSDVLETSSIYFWTLPEMAGWSTQMLKNGTPVVSYGFQPFPGWGSFNSLTLKSPLEAGVWGNGEWEMDFSSFDVPDSSFASGIGLVENSSSKNKYSAYLRRPVTSLFLLDFSISREDSLSNQEFILRSGNLSTGGRGWQTTEDGYVLWAGWDHGETLARVSFAHFHPEGRYWEALGSHRMDISICEVRTAGAVSVSDDSLLFAELHLRAGFPFAGMNAVLRGDLALDDGDVFPGGTAGILADIGIFNFQAGIAVEPDSDPRFIGVAGLDPLELVIEADDDGFEGGFQSMIETRWGFLHAGTSFTRDTLRCNGILLPSLPWGAHGRFHSGISWELIRADSSTSGTMDINSLFTLGRFAFIFAIEDVLDDWRSYSFGITWTFSDDPPRRIEEDDRS
jgi:hypothetical protein